MMRLTGLVILVAALLAIPSLADDQAKTRKQLDLLTAMATDLTGKRVVSITLSDFVGATRPALVQQRLASNLNYGSLFLARQLMAAGMTEQELAAELKSGKNIFDIANDRHADWKQIGNEAKKLNGKINRHLFEHFFDARDDRKRDLDDQYDRLKDSTPADDQVSDDDIRTVADAYARALDLAMQRPGRHPDESLDAVDSLTFRRDHARYGPQPSDTGMNTKTPH